MLKTIVFWGRNARWQSLPQSIFPAIVAITLVHNHENFSWGNTLLALLGVVCVHLGTNLWDDFFDYTYNDTSFRDRIASSGIRARIAKCTYLTEGLTTVKNLKITIFLLLSIASLIGVYFIFLRGFPLLFLILLVALLAFAYSGKPLQLAARGWGEVIIGMLFGPALMVGMAIAAVGYEHLTEVLLFSIPIGLYTTNVVFIHAIIDIEADKSINKKTLAVLIDNPLRNRIACFIITYTPYLLIIAGVASSTISPYYLFTLLTLPLAIDFTHLVSQFHKNPSALVKRKWYHFPMEKWQEIEEVGISWFMVRWYASRNLLIYFSLICVLVSLVQ